MNPRKLLKKNVFYKRAVFFDPKNKLNLKARLDKALFDLRTLGDRRIYMFGADEPCWVINSPVQEPEDGFTFGALITFTPGKFPLSIVNDDDQEISLRNLKDKFLDEGVRHEFLESLLFFAVFGNDLAILQSQALKSKQLEQYLNWFLSKAEGNNGTDYLSLNDVPPEALREKISAGKGVKSIRMKGDVSYNTSHIADMNCTKDLFPESIPDTDSFLLRIIKKIVAESKESKVDFKKLDDAPIKMDITLTCPDKTTEGGQDVMDSMAFIFRNTDDVDTTLHLREGGSIKGNDLKANGSIRVGSYGGNLVESEVYEGLRTWLTGILIKS